MEINERFVKFSSRIPYPEAIILGSDLQVTIGEHTYLANCVKEEKLDKQDGTVDLVYNLKFLSE